MSEVIQFSLNGVVEQLRGIDPATTLLRYLRTAKSLTGTKEGCAEGDCGSCTVLVGELGAQGPIWRALNACILFLPSLDGRAVVTVEGLRGPAGLHPVQRAIAEHGGSQCGFCTPGFAMSLYARAIGAEGSFGDLAEILAGNLCRCTGYGPLMAAAGLASPGSARAPRVMDQLEAIKPQEVLDLKFVSPADGARRRWIAPRSIEALAKSVLRHPDALIVAGATDVGVWVNKRRRQLSTVISVGEVAELRKVVREAQGWRFGAAVRYVEAVPILAKLYPGLGEVLNRIGCMQIRNGGTVGGNVVNASPVGDLLPALIVAGADLILRKGDATRTLAIEDFFLPGRRLDLSPGEFLEAVIVPRPKREHLFRAYKVTKRADQDISAVSCAFSISRVRGNITHARVAFGGMAEAPRRSAACEAALIGRPWNADTVSEAARALVGDFQPISDVRASAEYRMLVAQNLLKRCFLETLPDAPALRVHSVMAGG